VILAKQLDVYCDSLTLMSRFFWWNNRPSQSGADCWTWDEDKINAGGGEGSTSESRSCLFSQQCC